MASLVDVKSKTGPMSPLDEAMADIPSAASLANKAEYARDDYRVRLPNFEGPLDLLLHLIRKDQMNIYDIQVSVVCRNYLEYLEHMQSIDVNLSGEFLVMAATLTHLKSLMVLPQESEDINPEDDPRRPLVAQLLELERFKKAATQIEETPWLGRDLFARSPMAVSDIPVESLLDAPIEAVDTFQMLLCLKIAVDRTRRPAMQIATDPISLRDKVEQMTTCLTDRDLMDFKELIPELATVKDVIISFMAVLELAKLKYIEIIQTEIFGSIQIRAVKPLRELNASMLDQY
jgi:segregation and condensation protein A